jgi:hypothetical protein
MSQGLSCEQTKSWMRDESSTLQATRKTEGRKRGGAQYVQEGSVHQATQGTGVGFSPSLLIAI